jgi:hypothetical protein
MYGVKSELARMTTRDGHKTMKPDPWTGPRVAAFSVLLEEQAVGFELLVPDWTVADDASSFALSEICAVSTFWLGCSEATLWCPP